MTLFVFQNAWVFCFVLFSILPRFFIALGVEVLRISLFSHCCKSFLPQRHFCLTSTVVRWLCRHQTLFSESFPKFFRECSAGPLQVWLPDMGCAFSSFSCFSPNEFGFPVAHATPTPTTSSQYHGPMILPGSPLWCNLKSRLARFLSHVAHIWSSNMETCTSPCPSKLRECQPSQ